MNTRTGPTGAKQARALIVCAILIAGISGLSGGGSGNLGGGGKVLSGSKLIGSDVKVIIGGTTITLPIDPNEIVVHFRDRLVDTITAHPSFNASPVDGQFDPNDVGFNVTTQAGQPIPQLQVCENDTALQDIAVSFTTGLDEATIQKVTAVSGISSDPNSPFYTLRVSTMPIMAGDPVYTFTFNTSIPPNNDPNGLNNSIRSVLAGAAFSVTETGTTITFRKSGELILSVKTSTTDTGISNFCVGLEPLSGTIPTLSQVGMFVLVLMLTGSAILMLRRKSATPRRTRD